MAWKVPKPVEGYDALVKQFRALCALAASFEAQLRHYQMDAHRETTARAQLDGLRAVNEVLTDDIDRLMAENDALRERLAKREKLEA